MIKHMTDFYVEVYLDPVSKEILDKEGRVIGLVEPAFFSFKEWYNNHKEDIIKEQTV